MQPQDHPSPPYAFLERLPAAALIADSEGRYLYANPAAVRLLDAPAEGILGHTVADFVTEGFNFREAWSRFLRDGAQEGLIELRRGNGTISVHFSAICDFLPGCHLSVLTDLTERRRVESNIRRNEELYSRAFNLTPAPTNIRRLSDGVFVEVNQAFTEALGYWRSDVVGRTATGIGLWADTEQLGRVLDELRDGEELVRLRATLVVKDRSQRDFSVAIRRAEIFGEPHAVAVYTDAASM